jgi:tetratricopeptide (TPR) repeat protein
VAPEFRRERAHELVVQFMQRVLMMPTLLAVEDTHWLDDASQQLLGALAASVTAAPWLICGSRRPEGVPFTDVVRTLIELEPLPQEEAARLALEAAGDDAVSDELLDLVAARAGGNPLFVRELIAAAARSGGDGLPETVESLVTSRIDLLDPDDRLLLRFASVIGPTVELDLLGEVLGHDADPAAWERLAEFVERDGDAAVRFRHDIFRTVAYEGLSFRRRREIHGRLAEALEARLGTRAEEAADLLCVHFANAERWAETWRYATAAGRRAQSRYANVVAAELYERALEAAAHLPELPRGERAEVEEALGDVCQLFAAYERAAHAYEEARTLAADDPRASARLVYKRGVVAQELGRYDEALDWYRNGLERLGDADAPGERALLQLGTAASLHRQGRYADSDEWAERALADAERAADLRTTARALGVLDANQAVHGRADRSHAERALVIYQEVGDLIGESYLRNNLGVAAYYEGRWEEAAALWDESGDLSRRAGDVVSRARANNNVGEIFSDQGRLDEAEQLFEDARRTWRASNYLLGAHVATSNLGRVAARARRFADAHALLEEALRGFDRLGAAAFVAETRVRVLEALVLEGRFQEALPLLEEAHAGLREVDATGATVAQLERIHGYALHQARRPEEARPHFEESLRLAREASALYELALTLGALADTGAEETFAYLGEAEVLKRQLGVVSVTPPPLP